MNEAELEETHRRRMVRTVAKRKGEWLENVKANAPKIEKDMALLWLDDEGHKESLSVAAGPSLETDLDVLNECRAGREMVVADAALTFVLDKGFRPDFVMSADSSEKVLGMLKDGWKTGAALLLNVTAHPKVAEEWKGSVYWYVLANQFFDADHGQMMGDMHVLESKVGTKLVPGGNVSSLMLGFLLSVRNSSKVHLFGHDFCWKSKMYCGTSMDLLALERLKVESDAGTTFEAENTKGERVQTNLSLMKFSEWHAEVMVKMGGRVVNRTSSTILKNYGGMP